MSGTDYRVELAWRDGPSETVRVGADETILAGAETAGLSLPFGCRTGACATCTALLREGSVSHVRPPRALKPRHLEAGYVLTCIATPTARSRLEVGADVAADLVSNPWK